ncbi:hypothetical protein [Pseudoalteromonas luteoviolacea]|uniref:hypothetical protein n=1 Tax=Pseudoalteromonas luteoviolacea TaxID=43657 RepID=UPI0011542DD5|nr:hypothetical protein [Pseudoalteromonas luteoviolacea]TQF71138.1 hypothetical protein FLM44_08630 [Pseudoalteromonas luteoviolacea]
MVLTKSDVKTLKKICWGVVLLLPPVLSSAMWYFIQPSSITISEARLTAVATIIATYGFTMTGFVAAIGAYLISKEEQPSFQFWKNGNNLEVFFHLYAASIYILFVTFISSIMLLSFDTGTVFYHLMWSSVATSMLYLGSLVIVVIKQLT